jgi:hypothetical protein
VVLLLQLRLPHVKMVYLVYVVYVVPLCRMQTAVAALLLVVWADATAWMLS